MRKAVALRKRYLCALCLFTVYFGSVRVTAADDDWTYDFTVLTIASSGAWGAAIRPHPSAAIAAAIADCRKRAGGASSDCGARQTYTRNGWIIAYVCGDQVFSVSGRSIPDARRAAVNQEIYWREVERLDIPACSPIVAIGPDGKPVDADVVTREVLPVIGGDVSSK